MGLVVIVPNLVEDAIEFGVRRAFTNFFGQQFSLRFIHAIFADRTRSFHFAHAIRIGTASYIATGRSFASMTSSFITLFKLYARSHLIFAAELAGLLLAYNQYTRTPGIYMLNTFPLWLLAMSCAFSPWLFNPYEIGLELPMMPVLEVRLYTSHMTS